MSRAERIEVHGAGLTLGGRPVLTGVDLTCDAGRCVALLGPNGAGKSSLLALMAGDMGPSSGRVRMSGKAPHRLSVEALAGRRAMLVQRNDLAHPFVVDRVVELGCPAAPPVMRGLILAELGIDDLAQRVYTQLSGGEQRLVQYARVLLQCDTLQPPGWLLLDEPESQLDLGVVQRVMRAAQRRAKRGAGVIAAIHDVELASRWADEVVILGNGRVHAKGAPLDALTGELMTNLWGAAVHVDADVHGGVRVHVADPARSPARRSDPSPSA